MKIINLKTNNSNTKIVIKKNYLRVFLKKILENEKIFLLYRILKSKIYLVK